MKKFTLITLTFIFAFTLGLFANDDRQVLLFWDYNTLSGNPGYVPIDYALDENAEVEIVAMNDRGDEGISTRTLRSASTSGVDGTPCLRTSNWEDISPGIKYWMFNMINVEGFSDIVFSSYIYSTSTATNKGPQAFRLDYRLEEEGEWTAVGDFVTIDKGAMQNLFSWNLPVECNGCKTLAVRLVSNNKSIDDGVGAIGTSAFNGLDNTTISGIKMTSSVTENASDNTKLYKQLGRNIQFLTSALSVCNIYDLSGRIVYKDNISEGQSVSLNPGIYIINISNDNRFVSDKIIVE